MIYNAAGKLTNERTYHTIPSATTGVDNDGFGFEGVDVSPVQQHYTQTLTVYDETTGNHIRSETAAGTITRHTYDDMDRVLKTYVGTNDSAWNGTSDFGNLVAVSENTYTGNNVTLSTQFVNSDTDKRETKYAYDFLGQQTHTAAIESDTRHHVSKQTFDNLGRSTVSESYVETLSGGISTAQKTTTKSETVYDDSGRVIEQKIFEVNQNTGVASTTNYLTTYTYYNVKGQVIKTKAAGDGNTYTTITRDATNRKITTKRINDGIELAIQETAYDQSGRPVTVKSQDLKPDSNGDLANINGYRDQHTEIWYDQFGRVLAEGNYGTYMGLTGDNSPPASRDIGTSIPVLITSTSYNYLGKTETVTDPAGNVAYVAYDKSGRKITTIENYVLPAISTDPLVLAGDQNQSTQYTYDKSGQIATITAVMPIAADNQLTTYKYGVIDTSSKINCKELLSSVEYPGDSTGKHVYVKYNRQGQPIKRTDQAETVHEFRSGPLN